MIRDSQFKQQGIRGETGEQSFTKLSEALPAVGLPLTLLTLVDFIARSAYQMGKTPVLPLFAAALGAGDVLLGFIASISIFTGMALKPLVGVLSDRQGRRWWLLVGTLFFVLMPFVYRFIETPNQLIAVRLVHGIATAVYGPVTMAMVVEMSPQNRAARVGFFSLGRTGSNIVGPALGGFLLLQMAAVDVYTVIGLMSSIALIPLFFLPETAAVPSRVRQKARPSLLKQFVHSVRHSTATSAVWIASGFEALNNMVTYSAKAFLPIYALAVGRNTLEAGLFFTVQQGVSMVAKPALGWVGDRWSPVATILVAIVGMAAALLLLTLGASVWFFFGAAVLLGLTEALIVPSAAALLAHQIKADSVGAGFGIVGTMQNASKVLGPILAGFLIALTSYEATFRLMALILLTAGMVLFVVRRSARRHA